MTRSRFIISFVVFLTGIAAAHATPMDGQPKPAPTAVRDAYRFASDIVSPTGDKGRSRGQLLVLVETNAATDLVESFAPALRDTNTYTAILATYEDALETETDAAKQTFIRYNILRTLLARAAFLPTTTRRALLTRAAELAEPLAKANKGDAAIWETTGDLYALKDDITNAVAAYKRMAGTGDAARAFRKTGDAYRNARRYDAARAAYTDGIRADAALSSAGGKENRHLLYQSLASLALTEGHDKDAAAALLLSARVKPDTNAPYVLRLEVAELLLKRGFVKQVREYATAALAFAPDDPGAARLLAATR